MAPKLDTMDDQIITEKPNNVTSPQNTLASQYMDKSTHGSITRSRSTRINNANNPSNNSKTSNELASEPPKENLSENRLSLPSDTTKINVEIDHAESLDSSKGQPSTITQSALRSRKDLPSAASSSLSPLPAISTQTTSNKLTSAFHSRKSSKLDTTSPADDMQSLSSAHEPALLPSYKLIPIGNDILSDLRGKLNDLHRDIINLDGDYWILCGMFERTCRKEMEGHGWKSSRESHKPIFNLETEVESLKDMTLAYGKLLDLDEKKIDHANALNKRFDIAAKDFDDLKKNLTILRIDLEGDAIVHYPTRSEYLIIGNQPNHPRQFYRDSSGQWVQNGTIRKASLSKQKPLVNSIRADTPSTSLIHNGSKARDNPDPSIMKGAAEAAINRFIKGRDIKRTRHGINSFLGQNTISADNFAKFALQDTINKLEEQNHELEMDKADLNARLMLHSRQSKGTPFAKADIDQLIEENHRLSEANAKFQKEQQVLEKENLIMKNSGGVGVSLGKHPRSTEDGLDEIKTKKRKLEREVKELEYKKEDLEDNIKALEKKMALEKCVT